MSGYDGSGECWVRVRSNQLRWIELPVYGLEGAPINEGPAVSVCMIDLALKLIALGLSPNEINFVPGCRLYKATMCARHAEAIPG